MTSYLAATPAQRGQPREPLRYWIPLRKQKVPRHLNRLLKMAALLHDYCGSCWYVPPRGPFFLLSSKEICAKENSVTLLVRKKSCTRLVLDNILNNKLINGQKFRADQHTIQPHQHLSQQCSDLRPYCINTTLILFFNFVISLTNGKIFPHQNFAYFSSTLEAQTQLIMCITQTKSINIKYLKLTHTSCLSRLFGLQVFVNLPSIRQMFQNNKEKQLERA